MSERISVTMSLIPPDLAGACTLNLCHGDKTWWKTYRSEREAWDEASTLQLVQQQLVGVEQRYIGRIRTSFLAEATVDPEDLEARGFRMRGAKGK